MQLAIAGQSNTVYYDLVAKASGSPITSGTVNFYLIAKSGSNAGKWFRSSDSSWQSAESSAGSAAHKSDGHWYVSIASAAWTTGVLYQLYAKESGNLHIPYSEDVICDRLVTAAENAAAFLAKTGVTAGGTKTVAEILKFLAARAVGDVKLKSGETSVYELLDAEDGSTVIAEITLSQSSPYLDVTLS